MLTIDELAALRAERKDALDLPRTMTPREVSIYMDETRVIDQRLRAAQAAAATLAEVDPALAADTTWLAHLTSWRETLCDELLAIKSPIRDKTVKARSDDLIFSIRLIDGYRSAMPIVTLEPTAIGNLMAAAGYSPVNGWRGPMKEVELRIRDLTKRRAAANATLTESLLTTAERATRDAEAARQRAVLDSLRLRHDRHGRLAAFTHDGDPLPVSDMTPEQKAAFEAFR